MADTNKYIDVAYLQEFWAHVKNLPSTSLLKVTSDGSTNGKTLIIHLDDLYKAVAAAGADAQKHTALTTDADGASSGIKVTKATEATGDVYTVELAPAELTALNKLISDESLYVTKASVTGGGSVSTWGQSASIEVDGKTFSVELPSNPIANIYGGTSTNAGVTVTIDKTSLAPTVAVTPGSVEANDASVVTGGDVYTAIEDAKNLQEKINKSNVAITGSSFITGSITVQSSKTDDGTVALTVAPETTTSTATATALATKEYVDASVAGKNVVYSFKETSVSLTADTDSTLYKGTLTLQKSVDGGAVEDADSVSIEIEGSKFLEDSYLKSASIEGTVLTMVLHTGGAKSTSTETVTCDLATFLDAYTAGNGINIADDKTISVKTKTGDYITTSGDGVILNTSKLEGYVAGAGADNNIATKGYVDEQINDAKVTATVAGSPVGVFGGTGSITIKTSKNDTGKVLTVTLPTFTQGTSTSGNVSVEIGTDGSITTSTVEQAATNTTKYNNTKLAQAGYVDEKVAGATLTAGTGIDLTGNEINVKTTGYITKSDAGINIDTANKVTGYATTEAKTGDNNLVTKGYLDKVVGEDLITIKTSENNLSITTLTGGTDGKDFDINVPTATFDATLFEY